MGTKSRTELQQSVAQSLLKTGALNLDLIADVYKAHAERALLTGDDLVLIINKRVMINCGWPIERIVDRVDVGRFDVGRFEPGQVAFDEVGRG